MINPTSRFLYPATTDINHLILKILKKKFYEVTHADAAITGASFACDSFIFNKYFNRPSINFGLNGGNAHGKDEWVSLKSLINFSKIILGTVIEWCKQMPA